MTDEKLIATALERFRLAEEAEQDQRARELDDLRFDAGEQWPSDIKSQRGGSTQGGVRSAPRPMLTIPKLDQPVQLVVNQAKSAHLGLNVAPKSEDADSDTAEVFQDLYRTIQVESRASLARNWAFERAIKCGRGYYRVLTEYAQDGDRDLDIVIKRIQNQHAVYIDPFAIEPDKSDAEWAFIVEDLKFSKYKRLNPDSELSGYDDESFSGLGNDAPGWATGEGEGRTVRIAEYFRVEGAEHKRKVVWAKINAVEVLESQEWDGRFIPIIPVIGREQNINGDRRYVGIIGPNKDAARLFNYAISTAVEVAALEPKAPFIGVEGQFEGHEQKWEQANVRNFPYLEYRNVSLNGSPAPPPQRNVAGSNLLASLQLAQMADDAIKAGTFVHDPSLGNNDKSHNQSGRAVQAWQQQADAGNSNFMIDFADVSLTYEARVIMDLIPKIYDRPGRVARIRGIDDEVRSVVLNQPFVQGPDGQPQPVPKGQPTPKGAKHYDLKKGVYTVSTTVGKSWQTRLQQGADEIGQVLQAAPQMLAIIGDIFFKYRDFPGHTEISERLKKMVDPKLLSDGQEPDAQALQQQLQQAGQQIDMLSKELEARVKQIETDQVKEQGKVQTEQVKSQAQVQMEQMRAELQIAMQRMKDATSIRIAEINAAVKGYVAEAGHQAAHEQLALGQAHEAEQGDIDRTHSAEQAEIDRQTQAEAQEKQLTVTQQEAQNARDHEQSMAAQQPTEGVQ